MQRRNPKNRKNRKTAGSRVVDVRLMGGIRRWLIAERIPSGSRFVPGPMDHEQDQMPLRDGPRGVKPGRMYKAMNTKETAANASAAASDESRFAGKSIGHWRSF